MEPALGPSERIVTDTIGRLIEFWGFKRNLGRVWALLYLSADPLPTRELRERLQLSAGSLSVALTELQRWGVVRRVFVPAQRSEHFEAEVNLWKMVSRVFRERELVEIIEAISAFEDALAAVGEQPGLEAPEAAARAKHQRERIETLLEVARMGRALLEVLLETGRVDASELARRLLGGGSRPS